MAVGVGDGGTGVTVGVGEGVASSTTATGVKVGGRAAGRGCASAAWAGAARLRAAGISVGSAWAGAARGAVPGWAEPVSGDIGGISVGTSVGTAATAGVTAGAGVVSELRAWALKSTNHSVANHPPRNRAVKADMIKAATRARRDRAVSSSLMMGNRVLRASRPERRETTAAITITPMLTAARINRIVGTRDTLTTTP